MNKKRERGPFTESAGSVRLTAEQKRALDRMVKDSGLGYMEYMRTLIANAASSSSNTPVEQARDDEERAALTSFRVLRKKNRRGAALLPRVAKLFVLHPSSVNATEALIACLESELDRASTSVEPIRQKDEPHPRRRGGRNG